MTIKNKHLKSPTIVHIEFLKITQAVAMGFAALGALGYMVKVKTWTSDEY